MPIITVQVVKGVVLTSDEQKRELLKKMTDAFISVVGDVARPYTYCIIQEVPLYEWSIAEHRSRIFPSFMVQSMQACTLRPTSSCAAIPSCSRAARRRGTALARQRKRAKPRMFSVASLRSL